MNKKIIILIISLSLISLFAIASVAADYPTKPITIIVPFDPGGGFDLFGRTFASAAEKYLGQPLVVVNKSGASGMLGTAAVAMASPDGYTLGVDGTDMGNTMEWEIANGRKPSVTRNDVILIGSLTIHPALVVVPYNSSWKTLSDLIKDSKARSNHYAFCSGGLYGGSHLPVEVFIRAVGITSRHVPYKGGGPCLTSLVGGHVDFSAQWPSTSIPFVQGNKLRALAVMSDKRLKAMPEIATVKELAGADAQWHQWVGISVPKQTPMPIVERLEDVMKKVGKDKAFVDLMESRGTEVIYMDRGELARFCDSETVMRTKLYKRFIEDKK